MRPTTQFLASLLKFYRYWLSPWLGSACRFSPTCSAYTLQALHAHGAGAGTYLGLRRLIRCHPWCAGGVDPIPALRPRLLPDWASKRFPRLAEPAIEHRKQHHE